MNIEQNLPVRLNLGCASRPLEGYINIDLDSREEIVKRYPNVVIPKNIEIFQYDIFNLPFEDNSIDEIRSDSMLEHLSFLEEKDFFLEATRVLRARGKLIFSVPDFEALVKQWLAADDDWRDFYRNDDEAIGQQHWFGQYSYSTKSRWGYLTAGLFGPQNSPGQFHKNCYTKGKIKSMLQHLGYEIIELSEFKWKGERDDMLQVVAEKLG